MSEVAWMGNQQNANAEWIELENTGANSVDLSGWKLEAVDASPKIMLSGIIPAGGFYLLERTSDGSVPNISADLIYTGILGNAGEVLVLKNSQGQETFRLEGAPWPAGSNDTKKTMQWNGTSWITAEGTPREMNALVDDSGMSSEVGSDGSVETENEFFSSHSYQEEIMIKNMNQITLVKMRNRLVVEQADVVFETQAYDKNNKKVHSANYEWSFGDGLTGRGKMVKHRYKHLGNYVVIVSAEKRGERAVGRFITKVVAHGIQIISMTDSSIEIENTSTYETNIGGWRIKSDRKSFVFPENVIILPRERRRFDMNQIGFALMEAGLYSPTGKVESIRPELANLTNI